MSDEQPSTPPAESEHHLIIENGCDGPQLRLECSADFWAPCRWRPAEDDRESWSLDDPTSPVAISLLMERLRTCPSCWAVTYVEGGGMETVALAEGTTWPSIPVTVTYDEGVILAPTESLVATTEGKK